LGARGRKRSIRADRAAFDRNRRRPVVSAQVS
jgi:hypothetical protein